MLVDSGPQWRVEDAGPHHVERIRALFESVFQQEMTRKHWNWKYGDGRGVGVVVLNGNELVAYFGGTERRVLFDNSPVVAMQCGDSMVDAAHRGILTRKGPFYLSVTAFLGKYVGTGLPYLLSYGFPNARAMRLARRLKLYDEVGMLMELAWQPRAFADFSSTQFDFEDEDHKATLGRLWAAMADSFEGRAIGIRDYAYIRQRFFENPTLDYNFHLVQRRQDTPPIGLVITRITDSGLLLVDVVGESRNLASLIDFGRWQAHQLKVQKLYGWLTAVDLPLIVETDPVAENEPLRLPLGVYSPGLTAADVRDKWFFLCGDSDFL